MPATIDSLPPELLAEILRHASRHSGCLLTLALVRRSWRDPAQKALFSEVRLRRHDGGEARARAWLASPAKARFDTTLLQIDNIDTALGVEVITACRGIRTLGVHTYEGQDGGYVWCSSSSTLDIQTLSIGVPRAFPRDVAPLNLHLRHLVLSVSDELEEHHLNTIAKTSSESLTSLWLHGLLSEQCATGLLAFLADTNLPKLKTLAFEGSDNGGLDMWSEIIESIPSLTTLEIHPYDKNLKTAIMALGESATPNIELIRIIGSWWLPEVWIDAFMYIIKQPNLAGLRRLEFDDVVRWEFVAPGGLRLLKECEKRSIVVVTKGEHLTFELMKPRKGRRL